MNDNIDNTIFAVERVGEGTGVHFTPENEKDMFAIALAIYQLLEHCPELKFHLSEISLFAKTDENFKNLLEKSTVDFPDFNQILKN